MRLADVLPLLASALHLRTSTSLRLEPLRHELLSFGRGTLLRAEKDAASWAKLPSPRSSVGKDPDVGKGMEAFVEGHGYPIERHEVTTADGYRLALFRIPRGRHEAVGGQVGRPVVVLQHGFLDSSISFVCNRPDQSLAFILADSGFDVWLGNNRGNKYSRGHGRYRRGSRRFWDFSLDEMARYDFPAELDFVLNYTGAEQLAWVGHSMGNTQVLAGLTLNPQLSSKLGVLVALAPVAFVGHQRLNFVNVLRSLGVQHYIDSLGADFVEASVKIFNGVIPGACNKRGIIGPRSCTAVVDGIFGSSTHLNMTRLPVYMSFAPCTTSTKMVLHITQMIGSKSFTAFDYGSKRLNRRHYGSTKPPEYPISGIGVPIALFSGGKDQLADAEDVQLMRSHLSKKTVVRDVVIPDYSHVDFIWSNDAKDVIYPQILEEIRRHLPAP